MKHSRQFKLILLFLGFFCLSQFFLVNLSPALADSSSAANSALGGLNDTADIAQLPKKDASKLYESAGSILGIALSFLGIIFMGIIIYAGFTWMMARGNAEDVKKAQSMMNDAIFGLIIILAAYMLTKYLGTFLLSKV